MIRTGQRRLYHGFQVVRKSHGVCSRTITVRCRYRFCLLAEHLPSKCHFPLIHPPSFFFFGSSFSCSFSNFSYCLHLPSTTSGSLQICRSMAPRAVFLQALSLPMFGRRTGSWQRQPLQGDGKLTSLTASISSTQTRRRWQQCEREAPSGKDGQRIASCTGGGAWAWKWSAVSRGGE